jgi:hypothetical protein
VRSVMGFSFVDCFKTGAGVAVHFRRQIIANLAPLA